MTTDDFYSYNTQYKTLPAARYSKQDTYEYIMSSCNINLDVTATGGPNFPRATHVLLAPRMI